MTVAQFEASANVLRCLRCDHQGLTQERVANNGGILVVCPACRSRSPFRSALFLRQDGTRRKPLPAGSSVAEVWKRWGNACFVCGLTQATLERLGIGQHRHHVHRYSERGHDGPLVPVCASCHEVVNALQRIVRRFVKSA